MVNWQSLERPIGGLEPWNFMTFPPYSQGKNHPNWLSLHDFSEGWRKTTNQGECGNIVEWLPPRFRTPMVLWTITTSDGQFPFSATGQLHLRWTMEDVPRCLGTYNIYSTWFCLQNVLISLKSNGFTVSSSLLKWPYWGDKSTICRHRKTHHGLHPVCLEDKLVRGRDCSLPIICWFLYP